MEISYLRDHPEFIAILAPAIVAHWQSILPDENIENRMKKLRSHMNTENLPIAWVAHSSGKVFGTSALRVHDLEGRNDLTPWLGGVFVLPQHRRRGIASALCRVVEEKAWSLCFDTIYLFTLDHQSLYERLGWHIWEKTDWLGNSVDIMIKTREATQPGAPADAHKLHH